MVKFTKIKNKLVFDRHSLQWKFSLFVVGAIALVIAIYAFFVIQRESGLLNKGIIQQGMSMDSALTGVAANNALHNDFATLRDGIRTIKKNNPYIKYFFLVDKNGKIVVHDESAQVGQTLKDKFTDYSSKQVEPTYHYYKNDSGDILYDVALPVIVDLERWGTLRVGISTVSTQSAVAQETNFALGIALVLIILGIIFSMILSRSFVKPIKIFAEEVEILAKGDFTGEIAVKSKDEFGGLAKSMNQMIGNIRHLIAQVINTSQGVSTTVDELAVNSNQAAGVVSQVANAIGEVAKGNNEQTQTINETTVIIEQMDSAIQQIAKGAQEQAEFVNKTSEVVGEMASSIENVVKSAENIYNVSAKTAEEAAEGGKAVKLSVEGMENVKNKVFETANKVKELGEYSEKIGEIIQVIDDIAGQTNLLALNAAIEAARAGEHGKGFAVVADEVRKLAERSGSATKEIAELITNIQKGTERAVKAMNEGTVEVENGSQLSANAGQALQIIVNNVNTTNERMQDILTVTQKLFERSQEVVESMESMAAITEENNASSEEMSASSDYVTNAIRNIANISNANAASAEEVSASTSQSTEATNAIAESAINLSKLATNLNDLVANFKV